MTKKRVLFLNPPSHDGRRVNRHIMDPHISKGAYLWPPYDFLLQTGWFHNSPNWTLRIMDAMAQGWSAQATLNDIREWKPDFILAMTAPQSYTTDIAFLREVKRLSGCPLFTAGAVEHARREVVLERHPWIDGILLEPITQDLWTYLEGGTGPFPALILRDRGAEVLPRHQQKWFELPVARHDLIDARLYSYPAMRTDRFTSVLASYGCPFTCAYCEAPGFKFSVRTPQQVLEELELIRSLGIREVCFKDWTFAANKKHAEELLDGMIERNLGINWFTFTRADVMDRVTIRKMKQAGCSILQMGVETVDSDILRLQKRKSNPDALKEIFSICREEGLETMGTFILGLPGDTEENIRKTTQFVIDLDPDYASFNIITPLLGSELRAEWEAKGLIDPEIYENQDSTRAGLSHTDISPQRLVHLRDKAIHRFYFRPGYLLRRLARIRSWEHLMSHVANGWQLFRRHVVRI